MGKATRPPPLNLDMARSSNDKTMRSFSGDRPFFGHNRTQSDASTASSAGSGYFAATVQRKQTSPTVNAHSTCGRHSNQWLFSGWNLHKKQ